MKSKTIRRWSISKIFINQSTIKENNKENTNNHFFKKSKSPTFLSQHDSLYEKELDLLKRDNLAKDRLIENISESLSKLKQLVVELESENTTLKNENRNLKQCRELLENQLSFANGNLMDYISNLEKMLEEEEKEDVVEKVQKMSLIKDCSYLEAKEKHNIEKIEQLQKTNREFEIRLRTYEKTELSYQKQIKGLNQEIVDKLKHIVSLEKNIRNHKDQLLEEKQLFSEAKNKFECEIKSIQLKIDSKNDDLKNLKKDLKKSKKESNKLESKLKKVEKEITVLEEKNSKSKDKTDLVKEEYKNEIHEANARFKEKLNELKQKENDLLDKINKLKKQKVEEEKKYKNSYEELEKAKRLFVDGAKNKEEIEFFKNLIQPIKVKKEFICMPLIERKKLFENGKNSDNNKSKISLKRKSKKRISDKFTNLEEDVTLEKKLEDWNQKRSKTIILNESEKDKNLGESDLGKRKTPVKEDSFIQEYSGEFDKLSGSFIENNKSLMDNTKINSSKKTKNSKLVSIVEEGEGSEKSSAAKNQDLTIDDIDMDHNIPVDSNFVEERSKSNRLYTSRKVSNCFLCSLCDFKITTNQEAFECRECSEPYHKKCLLKEKLDPNNYSCLFCKKAEEDSRPKMEIEHSTGTNNYKKKLRRNLRNKIEIEEKK